MKQGIRSRLNFWIDEIGREGAAKRLLEQGIPVTTVTKLLTKKYKPKQDLLLMAIELAMKAS